MTIFHISFPTLWARKPNLAGILGVCCKSIYYMKGWPPPCHVADSSCQSPDWKNTQPGKATSRNSCREGCAQGTSHLAPLQAMSLSGPQSLYGSRVRQQEGRLRACQIERGLGQESRVKWD